MATPTYVSGGVQQGVNEMANPSSSRHGVPADVTDAVQGTLQGKQVRGQESPTFAGLELYPSIPPPGELH